MRTDPAFPKRRTPRRPPDEIRLAIERFLTASKQPVLYEPGEPPFSIRPEQVTIEPRGDTLLLSLWDDTRSFTRKVTGGPDSEHRARLELEVERFGGRTGKLILADLAASRNSSLPRRGERMLHREDFRRSLSRQYLGWKLMDLSSEPGLEHSLSPVYPRAWLRKGAHGIAAIAAPDAASAAGALTFGLIWLDYLRAREHAVTTHILSVFVPAGSETDTALRMRYLDPSMLACELFLITPEGYEDRVDPASYNNLDTQVMPRRARELDVEASPADSMEQALRATDDVEAIELHDRSISFRVHGLEIARRRGDTFVYGIEAQQAASISQLPEIRELARVTSSLRNAHRPGGILYRKNPESWLESKVRAAVEVLDETLCPEPVYGQVPAMAGARQDREPAGMAGFRQDRDVIDLVAIGRSGRLAVLELKASEDIHLPMQGLDYWIRVKWHLERGDFSGHFPGMTVSKQPPRLILVSPALELHPANERVLRFFAAEVEVEQVGIGGDWRKELKVMFRRNNRAGR